MKVSDDYKEIRIFAEEPQKEKIQLEYTPTQRKTLISIIQKGELPQEAELKRTPLSKKKIESKSIPSMGKEYTLEKTLNTSQSPKKKIPPIITLTKTQEKSFYEMNKKPFTESGSSKRSIKPHIHQQEVKAYYRKLGFTNRHQEEKTKTFSPAKTLPESFFIPLEEKPNQVLFTKRYTHYGSDIRWEEETIRLNKIGIKRRRNG